MYILHKSQEALIKSYTDFLNNALKGIGWASLVFYLRAYYFDVLLVYNFALFSKFALLIILLRCEI